MVKMVDLRWVWRRVLSKKSREIDRVVTLKILLSLKNTSDPGWGEPRENPRPGERKWVSFAPEIPAGQAGPGVGAGVGSKASDSGIFKAPPSSRVRVGGWGAIGRSS